MKNGVAEGVGSDPHDTNCEWSNWNWLWKKTLNCLIQIHTNLKLFLKKIVWYGHWFSTFLRWDQRKIGPVKVNQKMAFFGFVKYQFGLDPEFWKAGVEHLLLLLSIKKHLLRNKFKLQVSLLRLLQNHRIKTAIAEKQNWKLKTFGELIYTCKMIQPGIKRLQNKRLFDSSYYDFLGI